MIVYSEQKVGYAKMEMKLMTQTML